MGRGLLFAIEGTDGSGKQTQSELLYERFSQEKIPTKLFSFPRYDTPTGRIVGESYLGKTEMGPSYFPGSLDDVDPMVASLYYAADRLAAKPEIEKLIQ
ncbi:MAG: dTMP kinase, partial [Ulvibacter sp.]